MHQPQTNIPLEVVAAITAALSAMLDQPVGSFVVSAIQRADMPATDMPASLWAKAGLLESHLARRQFGFRNR
jgi:hypothetical protein